MLLAQTIIFFFTLVVVALYAEITRRMYLEIKRQSDTAVKSHDSYKLSVAAEWILKLDERFDCEELTLSRYRASQFLLNALDNPENKPQTHEADSLEELWDFFDTVGLLLRRGVLDKELVYSTFFNWIVGYRVTSKTCFEEKRDPDDERWKDFVSIADEMVKLENAPWLEDDQRTFLRQEMDSNHRVLVRLGSLAFSSLL